MDSKKLVALGCLFAIALMLGTVVLGFLSPMPGSESGERTVSLNVYDNNSLDLRISGIKDSLAYLPNGAMTVQYVKDTISVPEISGTNVTGVLDARVYSMMPTEDGSYSLSTDNIVMYTLEDPEKAQMTINSSAQFYAGYAILPIGENMYAVPGTPTIVGSPNGVLNTLSIIGGATSPQSLFNVIASHITPYDADYELLAVSGSGFEQYYESNGFSNGVYVAELLFLNIDGDLKERIIRTLESDTSRVPYETDEFDDGVFRIMISAPSTDAFDAVMLAIGNTISAFAEESAAPTETP